MELFGDWIVRHSSHPDLRGSAFEVADDVDQFCNLEGLDADDVRELVLRSALEDGRLSESADEEDRAEILASFEHLLFAYEDEESAFRYVTRDRALRLVPPGPGVYFMRDTFDFIKIGKADRCVRERFRMHRTSNLRAFIIAIVHDPNVSVSSTEERLHLIFNRYRVCGETEWFSFDPHFVENVLSAEREAGRTVWTP